MSKPIYRTITLTDHLTGTRETMTATTWMASHRALMQAVAAYAMKAPDAAVELAGTVDAGHVRLDHGASRLHLEWAIDPDPMTVLTAPPAGAPPILPPGAIS